jgi:intron-binding protein aquarius
VQGSYHPQMVTDLYQSEMLSGNSSRFQLLDVSGYLESYLWLFFDRNVGTDHIFSIILMVNEKYKNGVNALDELSMSEDKFKALFECIVDLYLDGTSLSDFQREQYYQFLINSYRGIENVAMRQSALRYLSLPIWESLSKSRLTLELGENERLAEHWAGYSTHKDDLERRAKPTGTAPATNEGSAKKDKSSGKRKRKEDPVEAGEPLSAGEARQLEEMRRDSAWFPTMLSAFADDLCREPSGPLDAIKVLSMERFAELLIDLLSQLPTRRFLRVLLDDMHFMILCRRSPLLAQLGSDLFNKLVESIDSYLHFEVDHQTGKALTTQDMLERNNAKIHRLQQLAYAHFPQELKDLVFCSVGELSKKPQLLRHLQLLDQAQLVRLGELLGVITDRDLTLSALGQASARNAVLDLQSEEVLWELLTDYLVPRPSHIDELNLLPLYPTEALLWDADKLPLNSNHFGNEVLALPKLNLQFLSIHDYLLRNFTLFRLESAYEIRDDLMDAVKRMGPKPGLRGAVTFSGWARMALPIVSVSVDEVSRNVF